MMDSRTEDGYVTVALFTALVRALNASDSGLSERVRDELSQIYDSMGNWDDAPERVREMLKRADDLMARPVTPKRSVYEDRGLLKFDED